MVSLAHANGAEAGRPAVDLCETYRCEGGELNTLRRLRKSHGLDRYRSTLCLGFADYQFLQVEAPNVPDEEMKDALRWGLKERGAKPTSCGKTNIKPMVMFSLQ